jgi:hypothetical protein
MTPMTVFFTVFLNSMLIQIVTTGLILTERSGEALFPVASACTYAEVGPVPIFTPKPQISCSALVRDLLSF